MIFLTAEFYMMEEKGSKRGKPSSFEERLKATGPHYKDLIEGEMENETSERQLEKSNL